MTTYEMIRCKKCGWLTEDENGNWVCGECNLDIHDVADEDCIVESEVCING